MADPTLKWLNVCVVLLAQMIIELGKAREHVVAAFDILALEKVATH